MIDVSSIAQEMKEVIKAYIDNKMQVLNDTLSKFDEESRQKMLSLKDGRDGRDGRDGKDGENGRDSLAIDVLDGIEEDRVYAKGTYASYDGGLWVATKSTQGMDGWRCLVDGIRHVDIVFDGERDLLINVTKSSGNHITRKFTTPSMIYRGTYEKEKSYTAGDCVTWSGSVWMCKSVAEEGQGPTDAKEVWQLAVKRGQDGKSAR